MPRRKNRTGDRDKAGVATITYAAKRKNIPPAGLEAHGVVREKPKVRHEFNPHLPPTLRFSPDAAAADRLPELLAAARERPLSAEEADLLAEALRRHEPWLEWSGKRERPWFEVDPVALHMHERVSTQAVLRVLARQDVQRDLFADLQLDYARAMQFYRHDVEGMDVYDPAANEILPTDKERIAAWFVDTDYDGRTFCICQAFFPDKGQWKKLARALGGAGLVDEGAFDALSGLRSVPFPRPSRLGPGGRWRVAVKVIDPRGDEGLRVLTEGGAWA